jgi:hypothetical protein
VVGQGALPALLTLFVFAPFRSGVLVLKRVFPPRSDVGSDWALDRTHPCQNEVEDLMRSGKLCGRAIEDNENAEGETKSEDHLGWKDVKPSPYLINFRVL